MTIEHRLYSLYRGLDRAKGKNTTLQSLDPKGKRKSKNQTVHAPYTVECWQRHLAGEEGLGVVPITDESTCSWGAIDIDEYPLDLVALEDNVKKLKLPFVVLRTKSGGAHLTCYFTKMQSCREVRNKMAEASFALGLGNREFYPKQVQLANEKDVGNWLNMPYFDAGNTERYAVIDGEPATLEQFVAYAEQLRVESPEDILVELPTSGIEDGPPCLQRIVQVKAGPGERNNVLFNLGVYARLKFESGWETETEKFNIEFIDPPLLHREVGSILKSLEKKNYTFTCNNPPLCDSCNREVCKSREFGISAFQHIDIGIVLDSVTKLTSDPPIWIVSLDGVRTEIETDDFLDQGRFRKVCTNAINKLPGRMKAEEWDKFVRGKLSNIEILEAPIETRPTDHAFSQLPLFLKGAPLSADRNDLTNGKWYKDNKIVVINGTAFLEYLDRHSVKVDRRKLWIALMHSGGSIDGTGTWVIPLDVLPPQTAELLPRGKKNASNF